MNKSCFIDSTIFVIATQQIGEAWSLVILEEIAKGRLAAWTDALSLLELLDSYAAQGSRHEGKALYRCARELMADRVTEVRVDHFDQAASSFLNNPQAGAREQLHAAVMRSAESDEILNIDGAGYENIPGVIRVEMAALLQRLRLKGDYIADRKN